MNRPKKKAPAPVEEVPEEEIEPIYDDLPVPVYWNPRSEPGPSSAPAPVLALTRLAQLEAERDEACRESVRVVRRWLKTVDTHFNGEGGEGFLWHEKSVVLRNLERLEQIDRDRDDAMDWYSYKRKEVSMFKTFMILKRATRKFPNSQRCARQKVLAEKRITALRLAWHMGEYRDPDRRPERNGNLAHQIGLIMLQVGLAAAIQWVHVRDLREEVAREYSGQDYCGQYTAH